MAKRGRRKLYLTAEVADGRLRLLVYADRKRRRLVSWVDVLLPAEQQRELTAADFAYLKPARTRRRFIERLGL